MAQATPYLPFLWTRDRRPRLFRLSLALPRLAPLQVLCDARSRFYVVAPGAAQIGELAFVPFLRERIGLCRGFLERHTATTAASRIAEAERSTSSAVVLQFETDIRIACSPFHSVPLSQQTPPSCTRAIVSRVRSPSPNRTSTWLRTTSLTIVA